MVEGASEDGAQSWRCFVAVDVSAAVRAAAGRIQGRLRRTGADVSFPAPERIHLTVLFLGDTLTGMIAPVKQVLDEAASGIAPFDLTCAGLGFFGPPRHPRIIWAGFPGVAGEIVRLHGKLLAGVTALGLSVDRRELRPHLTLGRIKSSRGLGDLTAMVESLQGAPLGSFRVERVLLMRSHRDRPAASYEILHESKLTGT